MECFCADTPLGSSRKEHGRRGLDVWRLRNDDEVVAAHCQIPGDHLAAGGLHGLSGSLDAGRALLDLCDALLGVLSQNDIGLHTSLLLPHGGLRDTTRSLPHNSTGYTEADHGSRI